jgi:hypothetical protein
MVGFLISGQKHHIVSTNVTRIGLGETQDLFVKARHPLNVTNKHAKVAQGQVG